jgi:hypothetical protein
MPSKALSENIVCLWQSAGNGKGRLRSDEVTCPSGRVDSVGEMGTLCRGGLVRCGRAAYCKE